MYAPRERWSVPDAGDPPPCFRQGDVVRLTWYRPNVTVTDDGTVAKLSTLEARTEQVALLSACCDLVLRPDNRMGVLAAQIRPIRKDILRSAEKLAALTVARHHRVDGAWRDTVRWLLIAP